MRGDTIAMASSTMRTLDTSQNKLSLFHPSDAASPPVSLLVHITTRHL